MVCSRLNLNEEKTQIIWLGRPLLVSNFTTSRFKCWNCVASVLIFNDLSILLDGQLTMAYPIAALDQPILFLPLATANGDQTVTEWRQMPQGHCMLLSAFDSTASTAYLQVSVANWYKSCKWSTMRPPVLSKEPEDQSTWRLFYVIFTGCRFDSGSRLKTAGLACKSLHGLAPHGTTLPSDVLRVRADVNSHQSACSIHPVTPVDWLFHAPQQTVATAASLSKDLQCWTVFLLNYVGLHRRRRLEADSADWRHFCSICDCYTAHLQLFRDLGLCICRPT